MGSLFDRSKFNGNISEWNVSNVKDMRYMFLNSSFTGDISKWDVSKVENMNGTFYKSNFGGDLSNWKPYNLKFWANIFDDGSSATRPYWINGDISEPRKKLIDAYTLSKELETSLDLNGSTQKKLKI